MIYGLTNVACWNTHTDGKMNGGQKEKHRDKDDAPTASINTIAGSSKADGREPKSCFGRVFNFKLGCFTKCIQFMVCLNTAEFRLENSAQVLSC